jgi:hypothetical protein
LRRLAPTDPAWLVIPGSFEVQPLKFVQLGHVLAPRVAFDEYARM